jgi:hypothetical protein
MLVVIIAENFKIRRLKIMVWLKKAIKQYVFYVQPQ